VRLTFLEKPFMTSNCKLRLKTLPFYISLAMGISPFVMAEQTTLKTLVVEGQGTEPAPFVSDSVSSKNLQIAHPATADTASLLSNVPGVTINQTGGVSSLPAIRGLADDRLRIKVDGMDLTSTCPNHMNPPMSYIAPSNVEKMDVYAGVSPVSVGGDSIGGSIIVESQRPQFANGDEKVVKGQAGTYYQSNNNAMNINLSAEMATREASIQYIGSWSKADNYTAGDDFKQNLFVGQDGTFTGRAGHTVALDEVASTAYETQDHAINLAYRTGDNLFDVKLGFQNMDEQLYPNQRMDLLDNEQKRINLGWIKQFDWGDLETRAYYENVEHYMDFGQDKRYYYQTGSMVGIPCTPSMACANGMPMYSESDTTGLSLKADYNLSENDLLKLGGEIIFYTLDDYWTASGRMMWPNTFENIDNGQRDRYALFAELETQHNAQWLTNLGLRYEYVISDADDVQGYNDIDTMMMSSPTKVDKNLFNSKDHKKTDNNIDLTALAQYHHDDTLDIGFGFARKVRSPNLYERYTWSSWAMAALMNNFVGDGNGYVGNLDLDPETAYTLSTTFDWHAADRNWQVKATPFYTYVEDYIDAVQFGTTSQPEFNVLQYQNQSARLYGIDISGQMALGQNAFGRWNLEAIINYVDGENRDTGDNLYNIMPLNGKFILNQQIAGWRNAIEWEMVDNKDDVNDVRNEIETAGYGLLNLRASHSWDDVQLDFGVENVFDRFYYLPTGGAYVAQGSTMTTNSGMGAPQWGTAVPGMGRSVYAGVRVNF
jgi:iron complex outermembrane receptor protein